MNVTIETYAKLTAQGRCSGRVRYNYLVVGAESVTEAEAKALRTHNRRIRQGSVPKPPKGEIGFRRYAVATTFDYVIL